MLLHSLWGKSLATVAPHTPGDWGSRFQHLEAGSLRIFQQA
jgi:hypothetical protein